MKGFYGIFSSNQSTDSYRLRNIAQAMCGCGDITDNRWMADECCALIGDSPLLWNEDHSLVLAFCGELYDADALRAALQAKGHTFSTDRAEEILLHGFEEFGEEYFSVPEGIFSFALYRVNDKRAWLVRDKIGQAPCFYGKTADSVLFSSDLQAIVDSGLADTHMDADAVSCYFQLTYIPAPMTIYTGIRKLKPATYAIIDADSKLNLSAYWELSIDSNNRTYDTYDQCKSILRDTVTAAVERRMKGPLRKGALLSGGFDSTIVSGVMSQLSDTPIDAFTVTFEDKGYDESDLAALVAKRNHAHHHILKMSNEEVMESIPFVVNSLPEPYADSSLVAAYSVAKKAKSDIDIVLSGDAGDEMFAGYNKYLIGYYSERYRKIPAFIRNGLIKPCSRLIPANSGMARKVGKVIRVADMDVFEQRKSLMNLGFQTDEWPRFMPGGTVYPMDFIRQDYERFPNAEEQTRAQYIDFKTVLEGDMVQKANYAYGLSGVLTRAPLMDMSVVALALNMPAAYKINGKARKIIFKETFADCIPDELFRAPKHGFGVPISAWFRRELKTDLLQMADENLLKEQGLFNGDYIHAIMQEHFDEKKDRFSELWAFYVFQKWYLRTQSGNSR